MDGNALEMELCEAPARRGPAKVRYSHVDMIDFLIANPGVSQGTIALRYGYSQSWVSQVMNSDAFQAALAARREELVDPGLLVTINDRFKALTVRSLERLQEALEAPQVKPEIALRAAELGAKSLGIGGHAAQAPMTAGVDSLARLADRLVALGAAHVPQLQRETIDGEAQRVE